MESSCLRFDAVELRTLQWRPVACIFRGESMCNFATQVEVEVGLGIRLMWASYAMGETSLADKYVFIMNFNNQYMGN